jgi:hypothetical protein
MHGPVNTTDYILLYTCHEYSGQQKLISDQKQAKSVYQGERNAPLVVIVTSRRAAGFLDPAAGPILRKLVMFVLC